MDLTLIERGKPVIISESSIYLWHESDKEFDAQFYSDYIGNSQRRFTVTDGVCVKSTSPVTEKTLQKWLRKFTRTSS